MTAPRPPGSLSAVPRQAAAKREPDQHGGPPRPGAGPAVRRSAQSSAGPAHGDLAATQAVAIGYVRNWSGHDEARLAAITERLAESAARMGFLVAAVYRDEANGDGSGFRAVMAHLRTVQGPALILPSGAHLSRDPDERRWMKHLLDAIGVQLLVVPDLAGCDLAINTPGSRPSASDCGGAE